MEKWKLKYIFCSVSWNAEMYFLKPGYYLPIGEDRKSKSVHILMPVPFTAKLPHSAEAEVIVPYPSPLAPAPCSHLTRSGPPYTATQTAHCTTQKVPFPTSCSVNGAPWSCAVLLLEQNLPIALYLDEHLQSHELLAELQSLLCPRHLQTVPGTE